MKILQLNNRVPYPLNDGGNIGVAYYTQGYIEAGVSLSMLAMNTTRHYTDISQLPPYYNDLNFFNVIPVDNSITLIGAIKSLLNNTSYNIDRFISKNYNEELIDILKRETFDIVQLEGLYLAPYISTIREFSSAIIVMRAHNIEYVIWERMARKEKNIIKKWYFSHLAKKLKEFEIKHINEYDLILPISGADENSYRLLGRTKPMYLHPFGIDTNSILTMEGNVNPITLYHLGAMDWMPNRESVDWLLENVMPIINTKLPDIKLYLAGRNMPNYYLENKWKNVIIHGEVESAEEFEKDKTILVVPLQSGGGIRIKIFQAMAMGKCIVTTSIGKEGIDAEDNVHLHIADTPEQFAQKIIDLANQPEKIKTTGLNARKLIDQKYNRQLLMQGLLQQYQKMLNENIIQ